MADYPGPQNVGQTLVVAKDDVKLILENSDTVLDLIVFRIAEALGSIGVDGLASTLPRVPWDTGELRKSGTVILTVGRSSKIVAKGTKSGKVRIAGWLEELWAISTMKRRIKERPRMECDIRFNKVVNGKDIAVWTHEILNPQDTRPNPPAAVKPGTGPKYLEITVNERRTMWVAAIRRAKNNVPFEIKGIRQVKKGKPTQTRNRYTVNRVKLMKNKIKSKGYYGIR